SSDAVIPTFSSIDVCGWRSRNVRNTCGSHAPAKSSDAPGELLWEEPLVWAFAADRPLDAGGEVPLALFPQPCVYR
ncbi:hypothetical protein QM306_38705, partial [Burkholderia cenocepacia]|nr:hypothetical protein [Burkholderia cenocepacia]